MPMLNVDGRSVNVDDSFLKLSHDQQNATVEEIAKSFGPPAEAADHGLSERKKLSEVGKALSPITSYPDTYSRMRQEAQDQFSRGASQIANRESVIDPQAHGLSDVLTGAGNMALGAAGYVGSPIAAAYRSIAGQPIEDVTGIPREYTEFAAQLATPGIGLPGAVKGPVPAIAPRAAPAGPVNEIVDAARRVSDVSPQPINVPRAFASDNTAVQRTAQGIRNIPIVGDAIPRATGEMADQLGGAVNSIASSYGDGSGPNVASRIGRIVGDSAGAETAGAADAARLSDEAVAAAHERAGQQASQSLDATDASALERARASVGDMSPQDMGQNLIARLRAGEQEARANKERLYGIADNSGAAVHADAVRTLPQDVLDNLDKSVVIDPVLTPASQRMIAELDKSAKLQFAPNDSIRAPDFAAESKPSARPSPDVASGGKEPQSLLDFLASKGGLGPDQELGAIGADSHVVNVSGIGRRKLVRQGGLPLDYAREAAEEAGYLRGDHNGTSTTRDFLDAIDGEMRGQKRFPEGYEGTISKRERASMGERERYEYDRHMQGVEDAFAASGHKNLKPDIKQRVIDAMSKDGLSADDAVKNIVGGLGQRDRAIYSANLSGAPVGVGEIENIRKRLSFLSGAASNNSDRRAAKHIMGAFDKWESDAFDKALFSGSDEALNAYKSARSANTDLMQRYGFNARDDAGKVVNKIVTGEITPQEVSNYIVGAGKVGAKGVSSRLLGRLAEATGNDPEAMQAIRGGIFNRLTQSTEGVAAKNPERVANDINEFFNGSGRDVANRLYSPEQRDIATVYANTLRRTAAAREHVSEVMANTKPGKMDVGIGPMQELANAALGKSGKTDEALFGAIDAYAKSGSRGDIKTLANIVHVIPAKDKGDLAGAIIRQLGQSNQTNVFSLDLYASQWSKYTPQAKDILFGNSGPYRTALDDIAKISQRYKDIGHRFGNPSGTAQNRNFLALGGFVMASPYSAIPSLLGGGVAAKMLSAPAGASSLAKWGNAYQALQMSPNAQRLVAFQMASRNLTNTASAFGSNVNPTEFMRLIQSPQKAAADDQQRQIPRRISQ